MLDPVEEIQPQDQSPGEDNLSPIDEPGAFGNPSNEAQIIEELESFILTAETPPPTPVSSALSATIVTSLLTAWTVWEAFSKQGRSKIFQDLEERAKNLYDKYAPKVVNDIEKAGYRKVGADLATNTADIIDSLSGEDDPDEGQANNNAQSTQQPPQTTSASPVPNIPVAPPQYSRYRAGYEPHLMRL